MKTKFSSTLIGATLGLALLSASAHGTTVLIDGTAPDHTRNGSFETNDFWQGSGSTIATELGITEAVAYRTNASGISDGSRYAVVQQGSGFGFSQDTNYNLIAGDVFNLSFWHGMHQDGSQRVGGETIDWQLFTTTTGDATGNIAQVIASGSVTAIASGASGPAEVSFSNIGTVPAGSVGDRLFIAFTGSGATGARQPFFSVDEVNLTVTPGTSTAQFALTITPAIAPDTGFDLEWDSQAGKLYNLRTSTDLAGAIADWLPVAGGEDIAATPPTNSFNVDPDGTKRFYAVEEFDVPPPPPLLSEDFEENDGGFTVATVEGTDWERGAPDSFGLGGTVNAGNDGSANAWATNLGTFSTAAGTPTDAEKGFFIDRTETALRSPVIDLTGATGAELTFAEALDFPDTDSAVVNLISDTTDDVIAQIHLPVDPEINNDATWNSVGPIDLAAGVGQEVRIEWRFEGTGGTNDDFMGWYIDDVVVTEATP